MSPDYRESNVYEPYANEISQLREKYTKTGDSEKNRQAGERYEKVEGIYDKCIEIMNSDKLNNEPEQQRIRIEQPEQEQQIGLN